jgi:hypothetical protein
MVDVEADPESSMVAGLRVSRSGERFGRLLDATSCKRRTSIPRRRRSKDRLQALQLIAVLLEEASDALVAAHRTLHARGEGWSRKLRHPLEQCQRSEAALVGALTSWLQRGSDTGRPNRRAASDGTPREGGQVSRATSPTALSTLRRFPLSSADAQRARQPDAKLQLTLGPNINA